MQKLLEHAIASFREDTEAGVPDLKALIRTHRKAMNPPKAPGSSTDEADCTCPKFDDGHRGFRNACPVHGGRTREDFARACAAHGALHRGLRFPASAHGPLPKSKEGGKS